ncbi:uncharacterized protein MAM_07313 [Metarhizium album ARSEF 1941]|uniref:Rhodopsin domain-containing protein n=1 Tax=Metarhizium album (strain ARSEF 1941) TaxID=1081103 RepID=A0A0B2WMI2_METAS|nr:uncharacterized protein MAM_07313 [Metarhizium album ARSEF 1941]KHN94894.1 hypothetical protein MAM_07313 [Metarhizium album ARSEF 1941]
MSREGLDQVVSWYICTAVAVLFVIARLFSRYHRLGSLCIDDGLVTLAACCLIGDLIIQQYMWNLGMAEIRKASRQDFIQIMKIQMIVPGSTLYVTSLWAVKIAMVLFYKKLAAPGTRLQTIYNVVLVALVAFWGAIFFNIIFQCYPHDRRWSKDPNYKCDPRQGSINYWLTVLLNIMTDVIIISLPISMVLTLQMKLKLKLGVIAIFALGVFVVIASIFRAYYSKRKETMLTCTVSMVETAVAIIASCLPRACPLYPTQAYIHTDLRRPALRTLFIGPASRVGAKSTSGRYELSSGGGRRSWGTNRARGTTDGRGGTRTKASSSEDELVNNTSTPFACGSPSANDGNGEIKVDTTFQVHYGIDDEARGQATKRSEF